MLELKIETDVDDINLKFCSAKIFCCFCDEFTKVKRFSRAKKNGAKGSERWIISNFDTHLRNAHPTELPSSLTTNKRKLSGKSETTLKSMFAKKSKKSDSEEGIIERSGSGEALAGGCQERNLLGEKNRSSEEKTIEADVIEINELDIALQV